uniref:Polysaccharide biosynthesis protein C-terminal domain-containing protein n=1 Tax=Magnetococcus massalia (strain MO-1) TaxID=451514 RepID=A0A1S7LF89_MAGMO|nr:Membrane protein of unknown function [Candidatus Magnetococcus massalia]
MRLFVVVSQIFPSVLKAALTILLIESGMGIWGLIWGALLSSLAITLVGSAYIAIRLMRIPTFKKQQTVPFQTWLNYAKIRYSTSLTATLYTPLDRMLLNSFHGADTVGVFSVLKSLNEYPLFIQKAFLTMISPTFSAAWAHKDVEKIREVFLTLNSWTVRFSIPGIVILFLFTPEILSFFGAEFATSEAIWALRILLIGTMINLGCGPVGMVLNMCGSERIFARGQIISMLVGALLFFPFIKWGGILGVASLLAIQISAINLFSLYLVKQRFDLCWRILHFKRLMGSQTAILILGFLYSHLRAPLGAVEFILVCIGMYGAVHLLFWWQGVPQEDRDLVDFFRAKLSSKRGCEAE